jgi:uncharacterized protein YjbI with pentapeptide repeats
LRETQITCAPDGVSFLSADLREADLRGADLTGANFTSGGSNVSDFSGAKITHLDDTGGGVAMPTVLRGAKLNSAILRGASIQGAPRDLDLSGVDLTNAILIGANLNQDINVGYRTKLENADLGGANLRSIMAEGASFRGANLECVVDLGFTSLAGADLRETQITCAPDGVSFLSADLREADLRRADLTGANFTSGGSDVSDFRLADLADACLTGANLTSALLTGASIDGTRFFDSILNTGSLEDAAFAIPPLYNDPDGNLTALPGTVFPTGFDPVAQGWTLVAKEDVPSIPCPEPSAWLLQSAALAAIGWRTRRRTRKEFDTASVPTPT